MDVMPSVSLGIDHRHPDCIICNTNAAQTASQGAVLPSTGLTQPLPSCRYQPLPSTDRILLQSSPLAALPKILNLRYVEIIP